MHHSRLSTLVIDCQTGDVATAAAFWGSALGRAVELPQHGAERVRDLASTPAEPCLMVQAVAHESRIHLDIETDDQEAEVQRLEKLGATRVAQVKRWWVMQAPTGQRFCVVNPQRGPLTDQNATRWE
jgi:hypothetical protein